MIYSWSGEIDTTESPLVGRNFVKVAKLVEEHLLPLLKSGSLAKFDAELSYIPIVMRPDSIDDYPARSRVSRKDNIFFCSPQLSYSVFLEGNFEKILHEYIAGLSEAPQKLKKLGATKEQMVELANILEGSADDILKSF